MSNLAMKSELAIKAKLEELHRKGDVLRYNEVREPNRELRERIKDDQAKNQAMIEAIKWVLDMEPKPLEYFGLSHKEQEAVKAGFGTV